MNRGDRAFDFVVPLLGLGEQLDELVERLLRRDEPVERAALALGQRLHGSIRELDDVLRVRDDRVLLDHFPLLVRIQVRGRDLVDAVVEELDLAGDVLLVVGVERVDLLLDGAVILIFDRVARLGRVELPKGVENLELRLLVQQRLVVVGAVHIDQHLAKALEHIERDRLVVDRGTVGRFGDDAADDQQTALAPFQPNVIQDRVDPRGVGEAKLRMHGTGGLAGADHRLIGALAQQEPQRADNERLARAGLAGDHDEALAEADSHVVDQGEVFDFEGPEHVPTDYSQKARFAQAGLVGIEVFARDVVFLVLLPLLEAADEDHEHAQQDQQEDRPANKVEGVGQVERGAGGAAAFPGLL